MPGVVGFICSNHGVAYSVSVSFCVVSLHHETISELETVTRRSVGKHNGSVHLYEARSK